MSKRALGLVLAADRSQAAAQKQSLRAIGMRRLAKTSAITSRELDAMAGRSPDPAIEHQNLRAQTRVAPAAGTRAYDEAINVEHVPGRFVRADEQASQQGPLARGVCLTY